MHNGNGTTAQWRPFDGRGMKTKMENRGPVAIAVRHGDIAPPLAPTDLYETEEAVVVVMDLPGHDPNAIDLTLDKGVLRIHSSPAARPVEGAAYALSERRPGTVERVFEMPASIDPDRIDARFDAGVLTVRLHKREEAKPRKITVASS